MCNKANSTLGFIKRNLKHCNKKFKETAYISLVRYVLDYSASVWDPYLQKDIDRIESIQRRGARFVQKDYQRTSSVTSMMNDLGWIMETSCTPKKRTKINLTLQDHQWPGSYPCHKSHSIQHKTIKIRT